MITFFLTSTNYNDQLTQSISKALNGLLALLAMGGAIGLGFLIIVVAIITWVVKKVWYAGSNHKRNKNTYSKQYTPVKEPEPTKAHIKNGKVYSPTGWEWDDEAKIWLPPKNMR